MARPTDKRSLHTAAIHEFARLMDAVAAVPGLDREYPGACDHWSVKDLLSHLDAWHGMFLIWEEAGARGEKAEMPAPGFGWSDTPALNAEIYDRTKDDGWGEVESRLRESHAAMLRVIDRYDDDDLFAKKRFAWTGTTSVGSYAVSATSSHYAWASKLIRQYAKQLNAH